MKETNIRVNIMIGRKRRGRPTMAYVTAIQSFTRSSHVLTIIGMEIRRRNAAYLIVIEIGYQN